MNKIIIYNIQGKVDGGDVGKGCKMHSPKQITENEE